MSDRGVLRAAAAIKAAPRAFNAAVLGLSSNVAATAAARAAAVLGLSSSLDSLYTGDVTLAFTSAFFPRRFLGVLSSLHLLCYSV